MGSASSPSSGMMSFPSTSGCANRAPPPAGHNSVVRQLGPGWRIRSPGWTPRRFSPRPSQPVQSRGIGVEDLVDDVVVQVFELPQVAEGGDLAGGVAVAIVRAD